MKPFLPSTTHGVRAACVLLATCALFGVTYACSSNSSPANGADGGGTSKEGGTHRGPEAGFAEVGRPSGDSCQPNFQKTFSAPAFCGDGGVELDAECVSGSEAGGGYDIRSCQFACQLDNGLQINSCKFVAEEDAGEDGGDDSDSGLDGGDDGDAGLDSGAAVDAGAADGGAAVDGGAAHGGADASHGVDAGAPAHGRAVVCNYQGPCGV